MGSVYRVPLLLTPAPEGGYTVTSPLLPELITEGDTVGEALENAKDALAAVREFYEDDGQDLPASMQVHTECPILCEEVITLA